MNWNSSTLLKMDTQAIFLESQIFISNIATVFQLNIFVIIFKFYYLYVLAENFVVQLNRKLNTIGGVALKMKADGQDVSGQNIFLKWLEAMRGKIRPEWLLAKKLKAIAKKQPKPHRSHRETKKPARQTGHKDQLASATS